MLLQTIRQDHPHLSDEISHVTVALIALRDRALRIVIVGAINGKEVMTITVAEERGTGEVREESTEVCMMIGAMMAKTLGGPTTEMVNAVLMAHDTKKTVDHPVALRKSECAPSVDHHLDSAIKRDTGHEKTIAVIHRVKEEGTQENSQLGIQGIMSLLQRQMLKQKISRHSRTALQSLLAKVLQISTSLFGSSMPMLINWCFRATNGVDDVPMEDAEPLDEAALIEQRRKRREAIKAKHRTQPTPLLVQALTLNAPNTPTTSQPDTPSSLSQDLGKKFSITGHN